MRELHLGVTVTSSLPIAGHQAPRRHTPSSNSAGEPWGRGGCGWSPPYPGCIAVVPDTSPSSTRNMQPCSAWAPGRLCTKIVPACRPRQRRKLGTPARSLSKATVEHLVASNNTKELFELMESELARGREQLRKALQRETKALQRETKALQLESSARHAAELRLQQLDSELIERTVAWLRQRGTLTMRGVLVELVKLAERHHNLRRKGSDEETFKTILDHIAYQPVIQCWKDNNVSFKKSNYASELVKMKEALGQAAHSVKDMQNSEDAIDIVPFAITEVQCRAVACLCDHLEFPYRVWDRSGRILREVRGKSLRVEGMSTVENIIDRQETAGIGLERKESEPGAPAQPAAQEIHHEAEAES